MSHSPTSADHDSHAAPTHSLAKKVVLIGLLAGVPLALILGLVGDYRTQDKGLATAIMTEEAIATRIQKVGMVAFGESKHELKTGEEVYKVQCSTCHAAGLLGSPKFGDAAAWGPRIKTGYETLLNSALKGKNAMTAQGDGAFSDYEVARALVYMANAGGAKFDEPKAPAGASAPAEAASAAK